MMVYDITDIDSFNALGSWLIEIEKNASKNVYKFLVGNKNDLEDKRKVTYEQGKEFADTYGMKFLETSAKTSSNVEEAFVTMTKEIIRMQKDKERIIKKDEDKKVDLGKKPTTNINSQQCCK